MQIRRTVSTTAPVEKVFAYLADFTTTTAWDPGTVRTTRVSGDGGAGTEYHNVSTFAGRETELTYVVEEYAENARIVLRGHNKTVTAVDTMEFVGSATGTEVTYTADFELQGLARLVAPAMKPFLTKLGDEAERGMQRALDGL